LAAIELQTQNRLAAVDLRRAFIEELQRQARQPKLDAAARRLELRRVKERLEAERGEKSRLAGLAIIEQNRQLWRLQDEARAVKLYEQKRLRDEAGMRAGGAYKRPVSSPQASGPSAKRVDVDDRRSRYSYPF
jgi:hypothetical protein